MLKFWQNDSKKESVCDTNIDVHMENGTQTTMIVVDHEKLEQRDACDKEIKKVVTTEKEKEPASVQEQVVEEVEFCP